MNRKNLKDFELRFGPIQLVVVIGAVLGCLIGAFALGYTSGQSVGFENALATSMANAVKLPISAEPDEASLEEVSGSDELYGRLNTKPKAQAHSKTEPHQVAAIQPIEKRGLENLPGVSELEQVKASVDSEAAKIAANEEKKMQQQPIEAVSEDTKAEASETIIKILGEKPGAGTEAKKASLPIGALVEARPSGLSPEKDAKVVDDRVIQKAVAPESKQEIAQKTQVADSKNQNSKVALEKSKSNAKIATASLAADKNKKPEEKLVKTTSVLPKGYFAQVAAPRSQSDADSMIRQLKASGFKVVVENANVNGSSYYRILVGPELSRQMAERLVSQLSREKYLKETQPFVRIIK